MEPTLRFSCLALGIVTASAVGAAAQMGAVEDLVRERVERIGSGEQTRIGGATVASVHLIPQLYERRGFRLAWTKQEGIEGLMRLVERSREDGLDPEDYHRTRLEGLLEELETSVSSDLRADLDILLTDSLTRLGYHLYFGKVNPGELDSNWNLSREFNGRDPVDVIQDAIDSESIEDFVEATLPESVIRARMKAVLEQYREFRKEGGWQAVPDGPTLKPGEESARVPALRERLRRTRHFAGPDLDEPHLFDDALARAVASFQDDHRLEPDGVVGPATLEMLNVPVEAWIDQIRVNLERNRWVMRHVEDHFVLVNIAGFRVFIVKDRDIFWSTRAQVGKPYRKTPVFKSEMKYLVINPTWTVPPGILAKDVLPAVRRDPGYLAGKNMKVIDRSGNVVDAATLDWKNLTAGNFPYQIRQDPGPSNALGRIKFIFPNPHFVFLHDTPSKALFERLDRTFSSGCIRVENPLEFARLLLDDPSKWDRESLRKAVDSLKTQTVFLEKPVPVLVLYWTVAVEEDGKVRFLRDVYERDRPILDALNADFAFSLPPELRESLGIE